ncbi:M15 family metallopeptidase [Paenibacillus sp. DMB20]|uniref:M15 family metallopeptidase n=1 Tax=Paenibacillus sp. DMB20 TaxID=1642570 RepID=UPI00062821BA|nr:M15 family metallopeptidase [Paenibacillus sp. DMB20]KKO55185.1 peptidase M15 [Paenibacillus sp. DMB20]
MKKWLFLLACLMLTGCESVLTQHNGNTEAGKILNDEASIRIAKEQIYEGNLVLVNKEHPVHPESVPSDIVRLFEDRELTEGYALLDNTIRLSGSVARSFSEMIDAAARKGIHRFRISSGYRDVSEQERLYREKGADYALPAGHSEHNLGLSLDIGSTAGAIDRTPEGEWLLKNAWKHGFVLRYPPDKTAITGIEYEPWHFRYVGLPHSVIMKDRNFTLEEYLDFLKEQKSFSPTVQGEKYEITYMPVSSDMTIQLPVANPYEISGNNVDGVIVTVRQNGGEMP